MQGLQLRSRFSSRSLWLRVGLAVVVFVLLWSAAWWYVPPIVASQAREQAERSLGRPLTLGRVTFQPWTLELTVNDIALAGTTPQAPPVVEVKRVDVDLAFVSLLKLAPIVDRLEIDAPMLRIARLAEGRYDVDDVLQHIAAAIAASAGKPTARFALHNIVVRDGGLDFVDQPLAATHRLRGLALGIPFISSLPSEREVKVEPHLAFTLDGSRFDTAGAATPFAERGNGELRLKIDGFTVVPYLGYLPRDLPAQLRAATLNADVVVAFEQRPQLSLKVSGLVGARGIEVVDAAAHELLQVGDVQVKIDELRPLERLVRLQSIAIEAPHVVAVRNAAGHVNLLLAGEGRGGGAVPLVRVPLPTSAASAAASAVSVAGAASASRAASAGEAASAAAVASAPAAANAPPPWRVAVTALSLRAGRLDWSDATTNPAAALALADVSLDAQSIAWPVAAPVVFRGEGVLGGGERRGKLAFSGQGDTAGAKVKISLASLPLAPLQPYLRSVLAWPLAADLSAELDVDWRAGTATPDVRVAASRLALAKLALGDAATPVAAVELVEATDVRVDSSARNATIGRIALLAPQLRVERDANTRWSFQDRSAAPAAAPTSSAAPPAAGRAAAPASMADGGAPWKVALGELAVERGRIAIGDRSPPAPLVVDVLDLDIRLRGYALTAASAPFHVSARVTTPGPAGNKTNAGAGAGSVATGPAASRANAGAVAGSLDLRGELQDIAAGVPSAVRTAVLLRNVPLQALNRYLAAVLDVEVQRALTSFKGDVRWSRAAAGATLALRGDATIDDFRSTSASTDRAAPRRGLAMTTDAAAGRQLLSWKSLSMRGLEIAIAPAKAMRFSAAETTLNDFFARIVLDENGRLNLQDVTHPGAAAAAASAASAATTPPAPTATRTASAATAASAPGSPPAIVSFGPIVVVGGRINYNDRFIRPNYNADLSELSGRLESFSSEAPAPGQPPQLANLALRGKVEGTASLEIAGKINPLVKPISLDLQAKVRDLDLPALSPYSIKYAGYGIERGKMSVDLAYVVQPSGELSATNKIVINQLVFGDKAEGAKTLPVKFAAAVLADSHGVINLDLPVSGSINDPQFSIAGLVGKAIANLIVKVVTAPFKLLASAFGGGDGDERSHIEFAPGVATLDEPARETLDKVAKALADRPGLTITIIGESQLEREADAWKKERLAQLVRAERRRRGVAPGGGASAPVAVSETEYAELLKEVYGRADIVKPKNVIGLAKDLPTAEMEALLLASMTVDNGAIQQLAERRGVVVRDYLVGREVAADRLFLGAPKTASEEASWTPRADLKLAAK